jgi:hypothetical protein
MTLFDELISRLWLPGVTWPTPAPIAVHASAVAQRPFAADASGIAVNLAAMSIWGDVSAAPGGSMWLRGALRFDQSSLDVPAAHVALAGVRANCRSRGTRGRLRPVRCRCAMFPSTASPLRR